MQTHFTTKKKPPTQIFVTLFSIPCNPNYTNVCECVCVYVRIGKIENLRSVFVWDEKRKKNIYIGYLIGDEKMLPSNDIMFTRRYRGKKRIFEKFRSIM